MERFEESEGISYRRGRRKLIVERIRNNNNTMYLLPTPAEYQ